MSQGWLFDQLGDVLHWIRQIVALVCGLLWGAIPLVGGIWLVTFLVISSGIIYGYYAIILKVDEEEFGGHGPLLQEGLFASVTLFLVHQLIPLFASAYFIKITDFLQLLCFFFSWLGLLFTAWHTFKFWYFKY
ncbi:putative rab5-interacting protein family [Helianthus annuus]|nr:putative rab5-interacting protein family [Helianthus annuus]KAJ0723884.1 putative rab5-interacting protein family [Helianthus annuus]